jgi:hypothetical protein
VYGTVRYHTVLYLGTGTVPVRFSNPTPTEKKAGFCQCQISKQTRKPTIFEAQLVLGAARENVKLELSDTPAIMNTLLKDNLGSKHGFFILYTMIFRR